METIMSCVDQIFVDGIANLSYSAGAFRFDLASLKQSEQTNAKKSGKAARVVKIAKW